MTMPRRVPSRTDRGGKRSASENYSSNAARLAIAESLVTSFITATTHLHEVASLFGAMAGTRLELSALLVRRNVDPSVRSEIESVLEQHDAHSRRAVRLLREMLDRHRALPAGSVVCNPRRVIEEQIAIYRPNLIEHEIQITHNLAGVDRNVAVDGSVLAYVTRILLNNAVEAIRKTTKSRAQIAVAGKKHSERVEIDITDTGSGVDPAIRGAMFNAFTTTKPAGSGIGLYWARAALKGFGASIDLRRSEFGHGASFRLTLPLAVAVE